MVALIKSLRDSLERLHLKPKVFVVCHMHVCDKPEKLNLTMEMPKCATINALCKTTRNFGMGLPKNGDTIPFDMTILSKKPSLTGMWTFRDIAARLNMFRCDQYNLSVTQIYLTSNENASRASKSRKLVQMPVTLINTFVHFNDIIWTLRSFCLSLFSPPSISHPHKMKFCAQTS